MASPDRFSSCKQGQKTPHLKLPLLEPKNYTMRYSKSASFSDTRSGPFYGYQDNTDGGLHMKSKTSSFSDTWPRPLYRHQDNIDPKKEESCINKAEDTNIKGTELLYSNSYTGKATVKEAKYCDNQTEKSTSEGVEHKTMNTKTIALKNMEYAESSQEADIEELESAVERLSLSSDGGAPMKNKPLSDRESEENKTTKINSNLVMVIGGNSDENRMTNIVNKAYGLETKQQEIEITAVKDLHSQHDGENVIMAQQNDGCRQAHRIAGMISESLDRRTHRSSNREDDDIEHKQTHYEIKIYEKNDLLCLLHKHPFEIEGNVKIKVDLQQGFLLMSGVDEIDVNEVENLVKCKLANVRTERFVIPEYQVPFVRKEIIQDLINKTLDQRHIFCYWRLDKSYIIITAWENEAMAGWFMVYKELFHFREFKICHGANMKLVQLYRSQYWEVVENNIIDKYCDLFSVGEFSKDGQRYLGVIAPEKIFDKVWNELEIELRKFRPSTNALLHSKHMSQIKNVLETSSESNEKFEEDNSTVQKKKEGGFTDEDQTEQQAERDTFDVGTIDIVTEQVQPTNTVQTSNIENQGKTRFNEDHTATQQSNSGMTGQIHYLKKWYPGKDSEHQHAVEKQVGGKATGILDYYSDAELQKYNEHGFEGDKENQQVKVSKETDRVHGAGDTSKGRTSDKEQLHVGQQAHQNKDDDIELDAAVGSLHAPLIGERVGQQETRSEDSNDKLEIETQRKDAEWKTARINDTNTVHEAGSTFKDKVGVMRQIGQVIGSKDNELELEAATRSFQASSICEQDEKKATSSEDSYDKLEGEKQYEDVESKTAKTKDSNTVCRAGNTSRGRTRDKRQVGQQGNLSKNDEIEVDSATDSYPKPSLSEHDGHQATVSKDSFDQFEVEKQHKDHELKTAITKDSITVYETGNTSRGRTRDKRQVEQQGNLSKNDEIEVDSATDSYPKPSLSEHDGHQATVSKDSFDQFEVEKQHKDHELKTAITKDSITVYETGNTSRGRTRDKRQVEQQGNLSKNDEIEVDSATDSYPKPSLSEHDGHQATVSEDSFDQFEVEKKQKDSELKTVITKDSITDYQAGNTSKGRTRDKRQVEQQGNLSQDDEMEHEAGKSSFNKPLLNEYDKQQPTRSEDSFDQFEVEKQHKDHELKTAITKDSITVYETGNTSKGRTSDKRQVEQQGNLSKNDETEVDSATHFYPKPSLSEHDGHQATVSEDSYDKIQVGRQDKDVETKAAITKYSNTVVHGARSMSKDNGKVKRHVGKQVNQRKDDKIKLEAEGSYDKLGEDTQHKGAESKSAIIKDSNTSYGAGSTFKDRIRVERKVGQQVNQIKDDKMDLDAGKEPLFSGNNGQQTKRSEDSDDRLEVETQHKASESKTAKLTDHSNDVEKKQEASSVAGKSPEVETKENAGAKLTESAERTLLTLADNDIYRWKFAVACPIVYKRIFDFLETDIQITDEGHVKVKGIRSELCEQVVRDAFFKALTDVKEIIFSYDPGYWEEIKKDFDKLKNRAIKKNRPVNPYATRDAQISVVGGENYGEIILIALDTYFDKCCQDVVDVLQRYEIKNGEHTNESAESQQGEQSHFQENIQSQRSIHCEKWKFNHLQKSAKIISKYEDLNVEIKLEGEDRVLIKGRDPAKILQVMTELQGLIKTVVKIVPAPDDLYVWKFAVTCPEVFAKIKQNIPGTVSEGLAHVSGDDDSGLIIQFDNEENLLSKQELRYVISGACKDVKEELFTSSKNLKDDIESKIKLLRTLIPNENPFSMKRAKVFVVEEKNTKFKIVLVALKTCFKQCYDLIDNIVNGDVNQQAQADLDSSYDDGKQLEYEPKDSVEEKTVETLQEEKSSTSSVNINCEKWKYKCLTKIDNSIDKLEKKFNVTIEMKDESTLYILGREPQNVEQVRTDLVYGMKKFVKEIEPVTAESYESLEADQNYRDRTEAFENRHHIVVELGKVLDYETDVETHINGMNVILTQDGHAEGVFTVELQKAEHGLKCIVGHKEIQRGTSSEFADALINFCTDHCMYLMLDKYDGHVNQLTRFVSDFIPCLQPYVKEGLMHTLYICTDTHQMFFGMKDFLRKFDQPNYKAALAHKMDQTISIQVIKGELAKQKVDVILNSSNENLQLDQGAVSKSILKMAGREMQNAIKKMYPLGIKPGEIAETYGYGLKVHRVFHSCLYSWNFHSIEKQQFCKKTLQQIVRGTLERTEQLHQRTVAFPALGTGVLKFPLEVVAMEMISAVLSYNRENPQTYIQKVCFVIYPSDQGLYNVFTQTLEKLISANKVPDTADDNLKYCVVISGRREHVTKAKAVIKEELLQPTTDISGNSQIRIDTQNINVGPLNAGHHAQSQGVKLATQTGQTLNMAARVGDNTTHGEMANNRIYSHEQSDRMETDEPEAESLNSDPTYDRIGAVYPGLTPDKGAIPKRPDRGKQGGSPERFDDPKSDDNSKNETSPEITMRIKAEKRKEVDPSCDTVLDKYLEQIMVFLDEEFVADLQSDRLNEMVQTLAKYQVEINLDGGTVSGNARDLATAEKVVTSIRNGNRNADTLEKNSDDDDDDDDDDGYENLDSELEESIIEKTLSQRFSTEVQQEHLKNVRREVFKLMNILYETEMKEYSSDCQVEFSGNDLSLHGKDHERLGKVYRFVKRSLTQLDDYYYCELDPTKPVDDIMKVVMQIKTQAKGKWDNIHVFEDDGMVRMAGKSFEHVDEFHQIVEVQLSGNQPSSRANRKFDAKLDDRCDNRNASSTSVGKLDDAILRGDRSEQQDTRKVFHTDEGIKIFVYKANILHLSVDCIVNAANSSLAHGGGIAKVIAQAAGYSFEKESRDYIATHGYLQVGSSCVTTAGKLNYKRVIHTVGPNISDYRKDEMKKVNKDLFDAIYTCLDQAKANRFQSIGIPSVSSGVFGVPQKWCALQYCLAAEDFSRKNSNCCLKEIHFIDIDEEMLYVVNLACKTVFFHSKTAKKELEKLKCSPNKHKKVRIPKFLKGKKNITKKSTKDVYPRIVPSLRSKLKIEVSTGLSVAIIKGKITDFRKGVIVCPQDPELRCEEEVAIAIKKHEIYYCGNLLNKYGKRKHEFGEVLVIGSKCLGCSFIYNVVVPQKMVILDTLSLCYTQVLQKADEDKIGKIAVPLFLTDSKKHVKECAQILMTVLIHMVNTKGKHHIFPNVCIYNDDHSAVQIVMDVMKERLIEENMTGCERSPDDEDQKSIYHTPPTSPVSTRRHQIGRQVSATSQESGMLVDRTLNINEEVVGDRDDVYETMSFEQHGESRPYKDGDSAESMKCVICMDFFTNPKTLMKCGHTFCTDCIEQCFKVKPVCPVCSTPYGILTGTQPKGEMRTKVDRFSSLPGFEGCGHIQINYQFPDGIQQEVHPNPGKRYHGTRRTAYLPNNPEGQKVLKLLKIAFERKLIFTIGQSVTTGTENIVTWNDIHHKTKMFGGPSNYGYPDPDYLKRVTGELEAKGVTENDIA